MCSPIRTSRRRLLAAASINAGSMLASAKANARTPTNKSNNRINAFNCRPFSSCICRRSFSSSHSGSRQNCSAFSSKCSIKMSFAPHFCAALRISSARSAYSTPYRPGVKRSLGITSSGATRSSANAACSASRRDTQAKTRLACITSKISRRYASRVYPL